jgi:hypothetical protein
MIFDQRLCLFTRKMVIEEILHHPPWRCLLFVAVQLVIGAAVK